MSDTIKIPPEEIESLWQQPDFDASQATRTPENKNKFEIWPNATPLYEQASTRQPDENTGTTNITADYLKHEHDRIGNEPRWYMNPKPLSEKDESVVYEIYDTKMNMKQIAKKIIPHPRNVYNLPTFNKLEREAKAQDRAATATHRIPKVFDIVENDGDLYMIMEKIEGDSLDKYIANQTLSHKKSASLVLEIAKISEELQQIGILHRDIKLTNIIVDKNGFPYLIDVGLANITLPNTQHGVGTKGYRPPESAETNPIPHNEVGEVYSFGKLLRKSMDVRSLREQVPTSILDVIEKACQLKPENRYQSLHAFTDALTKAIEQAPDEPKYVDENSEDVPDFYQ